MRNVLTSRARSGVVRGPKECSVAAHMTPSTVK
jgi:hypothetical protein